MLFGPLEFTWLSASKSFALANWTKSSTVPDATAKIIFPPFGSALSHYLLTEAAEWFINTLRADIHRKSLLVRGSISECLPADDLGPGISSLTKIVLKLLN